MFTITNIRTVTINADKATVWKTLGNFPGFKQWCSRTWFYTMPRLNHFQIMRVKVIGLWNPAPVRIKALVDGEYVCWRGGIPFCFIGDHAFRVEQNADGTSTVTQTETIEGILVPIMWPMFKKELTSLYDDINADLKRFIESR